VLVSVNFPAETVKVNDKPLSGHPVSGYCHKHHFRQEFSTLNTLKNVLNARKGKYTLPKRTDLTK